MSKLKLAACAAAAVAIVGTTLAAQAPAVAPPPAAAPASAVTLANRYVVTPDVTYLTASNGFEVKLDVYRRRDVQTPQPTLVFYHGGGWVAGSKDSAIMSFMPWIDMGWNVVNVGYRLLRVAGAPAAVEDAQCALRYITADAQAKQFNIDKTRIVVTGESAGGHLALVAGMIPASAGFTNICSGGGFAGFENAVPPVAAILNWYGITDLNDMLAGANARSYAVQWIGAVPNKNELAKSMSPLTYVRAGLPPILTIHGDADPIVPYTHATRLHEALAKTGVNNELFTVAKGGHGNFNAEQRTQIYAKIREFLTRIRLS
jgi:acetyl esterase/lipase